jgi:murein L,D-transpeptidase YafK
MGKRQEGDERTPSGRYALGPPRASSSFHRFIPVAYPTKEQRGEGRTGGAVGVHGPESRARRLGPLTTWIDWTAGCIAVGSTSEIDAIAEWTVKTAASSILIE